MEMLNGVKIALILNIDSLIKMAQGDEMGYFKLGSTVVLLFADESKVQWNKELKAGSILRFGEALGNRRI